jgi:hypothetical protein
LLAHRFRLLVQLGGLLVEMGIDEHIFGQTRGGEVLQIR